MTDNLATISPAPTAAGTAVEVLNRDYIQAAFRGDTRWFERHMSADAVIITSAGQRLTKPGFLEAMLANPRPYRSLTVRDVTTRVYGQMVQVDASAPFELIDGSLGVSRYIDMYAWIEGRWQVVSAQYVRVPVDAS